MGTAARPGMLLEREVELTAFAEALARAGGGSGSLVFIVGPAGIGKTGLVVAGRELACADGLQVCAARGGELETAFPYGVVRQLFEPILKAAEPTERRTLLEGAARLSLGALDPEPLEQGPSPASATYAVLHGLYWLVSNLATRGPLLIVVDDAHWADRESLEWILYLARRLEDLPVLVALAARDREPGVDRRALEAIEAEPVTRIVRLAPLSEAAVTEVVRRELSADAEEGFGSACHEVTGGNPFLLHELLLSLREDSVEPTTSAVERLAERGPSTVSHAVLVRVARLPASALEVAKAVALLGAAADPIRVAQLVDLSPEAVSVAVDALVSAEILRRERPLDFVHPIVRQAVYAEIPPGERSRGHTHAARNLAQADVSPDLVAAQLLATEPGGDPWVARTLAGIGEAMLAGGSVAAAVQCLARAAAEPPCSADRGQVLRSLAFAELVAGSSDAIEHFRAALEGLSEPRDRIEVLYLLGRAVGTAGANEEAMELFDRAAAEAKHVDHRLAEELDAEMVAASLMNPSRAESARRRLKDMADSLRGQTTCQCLLLGALSLVTVMDNGPRERVTEFARRALESGVLAEQMGAGPEGPGVRHTYVAWMQAVWSLIFSEDFDLAEERARHGLQLAQERASPIEFAGASILLAQIEQRRGSLWKAEAFGREAHAAVVEHAVQMNLPWTAGLLVEVLVERGELAEAESILERHGLQGEAIGYSVYNAPFLSRARLRIAQRQLREGLEDLHEMGRREFALAGPNTARHSWRSSAAQAHLALGELDEARELAGRELELAREFGAPLQLGIALRAVGLIEGGVDGLSLLRESAQVLAESQGRLEYARTLTELGAALRRAKHRSESRDPLRQAVELAHECGATPLEQRASEELLASGARPRRIQVSGVDSLTPSERRVAEMAAQGMTNKEIAQAQFVSVRTIETHLGHAYGKLDISARNDLRQALGSVGAPAAAA